MKHILSFLALSLVPHISYAQIGGTNATIQSLITDILSIGNQLILIVTGLALLFFFWGLAKFILNAGNENERKAGQQRMLWGIIALFVLFSIWGIVTLLQESVFGPVGGGGQNITQ